MPRRRDDAHAPRDQGDERAPVARDSYLPTYLPTYLPSTHFLPTSLRYQGLNEIKNLKKEDTDLPVSQADLEQVLARVNSSVAATDLVRHTKWMDEFGST